MDFNRLTGALVACAATLALTDALNAAPKPIVVAAYNVENWLPMSRTVDGKRDKDASKPEEEKATVVEVISALSPDIICIVEIGPESDFQDLQDRLAAKGLKYVDTEHLQAADKDRHVALLSKFPIVARNSKTDIQFDMGGILRPMSRGILDVTVQVNPDYQLRILGVHFKSKRDVPEYDQASMRAREALYLKNYANRIIDENPEQNLLLLGDFNDTRNEYPIRELLGGSGDQYRLTALDLVDPIGDRWTHYWEYADLYSRIDYLIANRSLLPEIVPESGGIDRSDNFLTGSDHRLIHTDIVPQDAPPAN